VAVEAVTGDTLWVYKFEEGERGARAVRTNNRGLAYWTDGANDKRVFVIQPGYHFIALNAKTGKPIPTFGKDGVIDLAKGSIAMSCRIRLARPLLPSLSAMSPLWEPRCWAARRLVR
jgi:glucose dehydrogenase